MTKYFCLRHLFQTFCAEIKFVIFSPSPAAVTTEGETFKKKNQAFALGRVPVTIMISQSFLSA